MLDVPCPHCRSRQRVSANEQSRSFRCGSCGGQFSVTKPQRAEPPAEITPDEPAQRQPAQERPVPKQPVPSGGFYGRAVECFACGRTIAGDQLRFRRYIQTGLSFGGFLSGRSHGTSVHSHFGVRTVCQACAAAVDLSNARAIKALKILALIFLAAILGCLALFAFLILVSALTPRN